MNPTAAPLPRLACLADYVALHAAQAPARKAAVGEGERLSYGELAHHVDALASELNRVGLRRGDRLAMLGTPGPGFWAVLLACTRLGVVWLGLNPAHGVREWVHVLRDAAPRLVLVGAGIEPSAIARLREAATLSGTGIVPELLDPGAAGALNVLRSAGAVGPAARAVDVPADCAIVVYTSGTTGEPKGAMVSNLGLVENGWWLAQRCGGDPGRTLIDLPINHIGCVGDLCATSLILGSTLVFEPRFDAVSAVEKLRDERITWLGLVPAQYQLLLTHGGLDESALGSVRHLAWGGAPMPLPLIERFRAWAPDLFNSYGLTECSGTITITQLDASTDQLASTVGQPVAPERLRIDTAGNGSECESEGEIQIRGPHVFLGYLGREQATREAFTADGWLRTGDLGRLDAHGLRLVGRTHDMFKSGGYNVYPREVESVIEAMTGVELCAVVATSDPLWGEVGVAFVQGDPDGLSARRLESHCRDHLANYKVPKRFVVRRELPLLPVGKVNKRALRDALDVSTPNPTC